MIHWSPDPNIFSAGPVTVRWYGLMFVIGFAIGFQIVRRFFIRAGKPVEPLDTLLIYVVLGTTIGARLGHCLFYEPGYYLAHPLEIPMIWKGGLASHGGGLGVILALWLFTRRHRDISFMWLMDCLAIPTAMVAGFIRIGNVMNSEILGKPTTVPWAFIFERVDKIPRHPAQLYESISYFVLFAISMTLYRLKPVRPTGFYFGLLLVWVFSWRIVWEFFKENQEGFENGMILNMGQILSIPMVLVGLYFFIRALRSPDPVPAVAPAAPKRKRSKK